MWPGKSEKEVLKATISARDPTRRCHLGRYLPRSAHLLDLLAKVPDPRDARGVRYPLTGVLAVAVGAVLAGARSFTAIGEWAADLPGQALADLGVSAAPEESRLRKLFARLDADKLDQQVAAFVPARAHHAGGRRVVALDGKTLRGLRARTGERQQAPHLVAALDHASATVLGQVAVSAKSSEIPAVRDLVLTRALHQRQRVLGPIDVDAQTATADNASGAPKSRGRSWRAS